MARAIADMALARTEGITDRFYSLSTQIALQQFINQMPLMIAASAPSKLI